MVMAVAIVHRKKITYYSDGNRCQNTLVMIIPTVVTIVVKGVSNATYNKLPKSSLET